MDWVEKYFLAGPIARVKNPTLEDLYMAILWPVAVGQSNDYVMLRAGSIQYQQNPLDVGGKGYITKADASSYVRRQIPYVQSQLATIKTGTAFA
jgi:surface antigen